MNVTNSVKTDAAPGTSRPSAATTRTTTRRSSPARSLLANGEPFVWLTGGALVLCLAMIVGLLVLVFSLGSQTFAPLPIVEVRLHDGRVLLGEVAKEQSVPLTADEVLRDSELNSKPLIARLTKELGDLRGVPTEIRTAQIPLTREREYAAFRLANAKDQLAQITKLESEQLGSVAGRREWVVGRTASERTAEIRNEAESLEARLTAIDTELQLAEMAADYFSKALSAGDPTDPGMLLTADERFRAVGVEALISSVARKRGKDILELRRRSLRTGNFDLTGEHFNWVSDYQIIDGGERKPEDAVLFERVSWGRFYGYPQEFVDVISRPLRPDERELRDGIEFLTINANRLDPADQAAIQELMPAVQRRNEELRHEAVLAFVESPEAKAAGAERIEFTTGSGEVISREQITPQIDISELRIVKTGSETAWREFESRHDEVRDRFYQITKLQKVDLGHEFAGQDEARLAVRQAEIDHDIQVLNLVQELRSHELTLDSLNEQQERASSLVLSIKRLFGRDSQIAMLAEKTQQMVRQDVDSQKQLVQTNLQKLRDQFAALPKTVSSAIDEYLNVDRLATLETNNIKARIDKLLAENSRSQLKMKTSDGRVATLTLGDIVRGYQANKLSAANKRGIYFSRWWEFLSDEPREANSEGGVFPAIWGTVTMTLIMSLAVAPFGVLAAIYLREYAKSGAIVSAVRIAINNLAGVPSIVFGVFGLGFFCYIIGAYVDGGPRNAGFQTLPPARWYAWLAALAVLSVAGFVTGILSVGRPGSGVKRSQRLLGAASVLLWLTAVATLMYVLITTPYFRGFYEANLPNPYWGKGGVLWSSLTLSLMTLPVVIVATEEALSAVPNSMREGSYGCGASKWQTIRRVVLPQAMPGIMTGMILAMARGAGEVAPLMLVGAVKLAPELPIDGVFPFVHANRSFMHLGFHVFDLGFQSQNSEAARPMVYTTTLLLNVIITILNFMAIWLRAYLKRRFVAGQF